MTKCKIKPASGLSACMGKSFKVIYILYCSTQHFLRLKCFGDLRAINLSSIPGSPKGLFSDLGQVHGK